MPKPKPPKEAKLDGIFGKIMRSRGVCEYCGNTRDNSVLQCAHGFSRRYRGTRWTEEANFCLCSGCHVKFTYDPIRWDDWMRMKLGDRYEPLRLQALAITKADRFEIYEELKERWREIDEGGSNRS